jgi:hypothetical protein
MINVHRMNFGHVNVFVTINSTFQRFDYSPKLFIHVNYLFLLLKNCEENLVIP